jgi:hypothetical protein
MIRQDGTIYFATELVALIDRFLREYQEREGPLQCDLDRGLVIAYLLDVMRCDLDLLGDCLDRQDLFRDLSPKRVLAECAKRDPDGLERRREQVQRALQEAGWLPLRQD